MRPHPVKMQLQTGTSFTVLSLSQSLSLFPSSLLFRLFFFIQLQLPFKF
uniref:Uncharacterized protein n=1 Tax=Anguilla anguilla TaxID=7936 RepID=A0A0E9R6N4_ANGAN